MKLFRSCILALFCITASHAAFSQNKKIDKSLSKVDTYYASGNFLKASSGLQKVKKTVLAKPDLQTYLPGIYIREARINLSLGMLTGFDNALNTALTTSQTTFGDNSTNYATTLIEVGEIYNEYGNYRLSDEYLDRAFISLERSNQLTDALKGRIALAQAEAMIGQGFWNDAIELLKEYEKYFASRAIDKESVVEGTSIKTKRIPEEELPKRYGDYAKLLNLRIKADAKQGKFSIKGVDENNTDIGYCYGIADSWLKGKSRFLGETSLAEVESRYIVAKALKENNTPHDPKFDFDNILNDLKRKTSPTNNLAQNLYLDYLDDLLLKGNRARYQNVKLEYEKLLKKFPSGSVLRTNMKAVEFDSKMEQDKTKNLESGALTVLNSLPKFYNTTIQIVEFLYDVTIKEKRYAAAETYLNQLVSIKKELCGENAPEYHLAKIHLANFYLDYTNKIEEAGSIYTESYFGVVEQQIGSQHKDLLDILNHIATWYELTDKYQLASKTLINAGRSARDKFQDDDILYGIELNKLAKLQLKLGEYEEAEKNINKAIEVIDLKTNRKYQEYEPAKINAIETQAKLYGIKGMFDEAERNLDRSRKLIKDGKVLIGSETSTAEELSALFIQLGRYAETDRLLADLITDYQKLYGANSMRLIEPLVNKGRILLARGDYTEAERTASRANQIAVKTYGDNSTKTAPTQKLLSDIYYTLGDYDKAEINVLKAVASQEKQFGRNHIEVAKSLSQLALIKFHKGGNKKEVEKLMLEARDIVAQRLGNQNPQYAEILKNVAILYISEKKFDIAFSSLTIAENIWRTKTGTKNNINSASIYTLTGDVYYQQKNYKKAEDFYNQAKDLYEKFFSATHPEYVKVLSKLSKVYYQQKDFKKAKKLIEESLGNYENFIKDYFPALSEREKAKYWNTIKGDFEFYNTLAFGNLEDFKDLTGKVYNYQLLTKALLLSSSIKIRERILNSTDEDLKVQFNNWVQQKEKLTLALSMGPEQLIENEIDPVALQQNVERLEKDLSQKSELFGQSFEDKRIVFDDVKKSLKPNEVAIEMVRYRYFNHDFTDSVIYAALYLKPELSRPKAIILKDGQRMESRFFKFYRNAITGKIPDGISYGVFWKPINDEIGQAATIYLSADGVYNQINLEAIPTPDGRYVIDNSNIVLVSNTKDLYIKKIKSKVTSNNNTASMFGNPTFYLSASADSKWTSLPGTEKEVAQLEYILKQKGWTTTEYVEKLATEEKVKELNSPKVFHIATHGFTRPSQQQTLEDGLESNEAMLTQNPLMRTGLLLKGAGDLMDKTDYNYNMESGILTAYEAMSLNLDQTDLVVLSACETGLGDLEAGEGVYGLQRAFLVAGAKILVMSMFKVDDDATQKLMVRFYQKWINSNNLRQSFIESKKELRTEYPEPIYWGAFMMIGLD
ncbi:MAG TPA: CHAT domain-containing protein [Chryseolinea sp.]|nr:CHAT domain-containing protein [Chryseolinea sp.]